MLLYDKAKRAGFGLPDCPVFEISNVNAFVVEGLKVSLRGCGSDDTALREELFKVENACPPFPTFWMEYEVLGTKLGTLCQATKSSDGWSCRLVNFLGDALIAIMAGADSLYPSRSLVYTPAFALANDGSMLREDLDSLVKIEVKWRMKMVASSGDRDPLKDYVVAQAEALSNILTFLNALMFMNMHPRSVRQVERKSPRPERREAVTGPIC